MMTYFTYADIKRTQHIFSLTCMMWMATYLEVKLRGMILVVSSEGAMSKRVHNVQVTER